MASKSDSVVPGNTPTKPSEEERLEQLRAVLLGPQMETIAALRQQIDTLEARLTNPELRVADASEILAPAVTKSRNENDRLSTALKPIVVAEFKQVSRDDPETMAEALFPILGPAVRKMIMSIITPDKNKKKTGYRLEQLFLIEKSSGLPVCHVASDKAETQDADMVSGMLSAIQSFVHDAFETNEFDGLNTLELGELSVWIEWGPQAVLAAVVRGAPPKKLRDALQEKIEDIHQSYDAELSDYDGDSEVFDPLKPELIEFLDSHDGTLKSRVKNLSGKAKRNLIVAGIVFLAICAWIVNSRIEQSKWSEFVAQLHDTPGIVVTEQKEHGGVFHVHGLRDPLAADPQLLLNEAETTRDVEFFLEPYTALQPEFVQQRTVKQLNPPDSVDIAVSGEVLYVTGSASRDWIAASKPVAKSTPGISLVIFNVRPIGN